MTTSPRDDDGSLEHINSSIEAAQHQIARLLRSGAVEPRSMLRALERVLTEAQEASQPREQVLFSVADLIGHYWEHIEQRRATLPTGIPALDNVLSGGLETKRLKVILGAPGSGKTTFTNQLATHVANSGRPVIYVTSEDSPFTLLAKTISRIGNIPYGDVLKGRESARDRINDAFHGYSGQLSAERLIYLDATMGITLPTIADMAQQHFERYRQAENGGSGVLVIDYLQRMARAQRGPVRLELRQAVGELTDELRGIANSLDCCVIALASQNRASGYGASNGSALASAKESGDIEYTADVIMSLAEDKREGANKGERRRAEVITRDRGMMKPWLLAIDKNRIGQNDAKVELWWIPERQTFIQAEEG